MLRRDRHLGAQLPEAGRRTAVRLPLFGAGSRASFWEPGSIGWMSKGLPRAFTDRLERPSGRPEEWFLGSLQTKVLEALSKRGPSTVREVAHTLRDKFAYTTVMTVLGRLHEKGLVGREQHGKGYLYTPRYSALELRDRMAKYLVDEIVEDFGDVALAHFAGALDRADRTRLSKLRRVKGPK